MIVNCEGCESGFHVDERLIKPSGSKVRCSKCRHVFVAYPPPSAADTSEPLTLTDEVPAADPAPVAAATDDIDLKLDALFPDELADDGAAVAAKTDPGPQAAEALLEAARPGQEAFAAGPLADNLELDLDLDLDLNDKSAMSAPSGPAGTVAPEELGASAVLPSLGMTDTDFGEFDLSKDQPKPEAKPGEEPFSLDELELNLSELDVSEAAAAPVEPESPPLDNELELDFDLEALAAEGDSPNAAKAPESALEKALESSDLYESAGATAAALGDLEQEFEAAAPMASRPDSTTAQKPSGADELDLSDLEEMLEGVSSSSAVQPPPPAAGDIDFELDLSAEVAADTPKSVEPEDLDLAAITQDLDADKALASAGDAIEEELELDFDLERDESAVKAKEPAMQAAGDELDFSDMAGILEGDALAAETTTPETSDLDLMLEDETALGGAAKASPAGSSAQQDLLLDIEALLKEDSEIDSTGGAPGAADMDIVIESADELADDKLFGEPAGALKAARDSAAAPGAEAVTDEFATDEFTGSDIGGATSVLDLEPVGADAAMAAAAPRSSMRKPLLAVLGALVLGILALVVMRFTGVSIPFLSDLDIQVPGIGNLFKSEPADPLGNLKIAPLAEKISADFIDNAAAGRLVVVRGEVRNTYDHPRSSIRVTAKLYTQDKMVAKTATVFAGNVLSKEELGTLDLITMNSRFNMKTGANNINANVKPGDAIPFMAVFSNLPPNLDEYSVEIAGSLK